MSNFMKILPVEAELFHTGRRTDADMMKLIVAFPNFCESAEKTIISLHKPQLLVLVIETAFVLCELRTRS